MPQSPLHCLVPSKSDLVPPTYPPDRLLLNKGGVVRVQLTFRDAAKAPDVETHSVSDESFAEAVKDRVRDYRLPCLPAGAKPVVATQVFEFTPHDDRKVIVGNALDDISAQHPCHFTKTPEGVPRYPRIFMGSQKRSGAVLMRMTFTDKDKPPRTQVLYTAGGGHFVETVESYVQDYRLDCPAPFTPVTATQTFHFRMQGQDEYGLKNMSLRQFVSVMDRLSEQRVRFDFSKMKCPFDLRLTLFQPHATNKVGEVESSDPNRREFIDWLSSVALKLPAQAYEQVIGSTITVAVPCGVLDLM